MYYHADCGHIIEESQSSSFISEGGWRDYTHMYLKNCPACDSRYPYIKPLDMSVMPESEKLVYRLLQADHCVHIPTHRSPTRSIRLESVEKEDLGIEVQHDIIREIDEYETDVLLRIENK